MIATGPFGDVKNYNGRDLYLSWDLRASWPDGTVVEPPPVPALDEVIEHGSPARSSSVWASSLGGCPAVLHRRRSLEGGWVYAAGQGSLADPRSSLHRRDRIGITRER